MDNIPTRLGHDGWDGSAAGNADFIHTWDLGDAVLVARHNSEVIMSQQTMFYLAIGTVEIVVPTSGHRENRLLVQLGA